MSDRFMSRFWRVSAVVGTLFLLFSIAFAVWVVWPWPRVVVMSGTTLLNEPEDGTYQTGDVLRWSSTNVCQPKGRTDVSVFVRQEIPAAGDRPSIQVDTPVVARVFELGGAVCAEDNQTSLWLPGSLPTGTYSIYLTACVPNPTPWPRCSVIDGPQFKMERIALAEGATL